MSNRKCLLFIGAEMVNIGRLKANSAAQSLSGSRADPEFLKRGFKFIKGGLISSFNMIIGYFFPELSGNLL